MTKNAPPPPPKSSPWPLRIAGIVLVAMAILSVLRVMQTKSETIAYSEFRAALEADRIARVRIAAHTIDGQYRGAGEGVTSFQTVRVEDPELFSELRQRGVEVRGEPDANTWLSFLPWILTLGGMWFLFRGARGAAPGGLVPVGKSHAKVFVEHDVEVRFEDVAGVDEAKAELAEILEFLRTPEKFARLGGHVPKGVLLVGPPGTGKTLLARAVAGEAKVPFFSISGSEFVELFVGVGAARVRELFREAKERAPCIVFIDELDALGKARGSGPTAHEEREQTLNQLLVEMDGFDRSSGVVLMAATNRPEILDPALLRAGRFDRHVLVDRPDRPGRLAILKVHAKKVPLADDVDLDQVAGMTVGMVGADLANLVNEASLLAVRRGRESVAKTDFEDALERVVAGLEKRNRVLSKAERERVAFHELGHALTALALPGADPVRKVSIIPRGIGALGYTIQLPTEDRFLMTQSQLEQRIAVLLGGRISELVIFGDLSTGAQDDLSKATELAKAMVLAYGMSPQVGPVALQPDARTTFLGVQEPRAAMSEELARTIDAEIKRILSEQAARVATLLEARVALLRTAAATLLEKETLSGEELQALVAGDAGRRAA